MTRYQWLRGLVLLTITIFLACSPAAKEDSQTKGSPASPSAGKDQAPSTQEKPSKATEPSFLDLVKQSKATTYKVTYKMSGTDSGQSISGEQTWYSKPPKTRFDISMTDGAQKGSASMYLLEDSMYMCTSERGESMCLKMAKPQAMQQNQGARMQEQIQSNPEQFDTTYQGTRQIAGQAANCFAIKAKKSTDPSLTEGTFCLSTQGVLLLMQSKGQGSELNMEATAFSTAVSDGDFKLPAQAMDMPQMPVMPGGIPGGPR